ncbi:MAG: hypothetical protein WBZ29_16410 [Methanocella sp.]
MSVVYVVYVVAVVFGAGSEHTILMNASISYAHLENAEESNNRKRNDIKAKE